MRLRGSPAGGVGHEQKLPPWTANTPSNCRFIGRGAEWPGAQGPGPSRPLSPHPRRVLLRELQPLGMVPQGCCATAPQRLRLSVGINAPCSLHLLLVFMLNGSLRFVPPPPPGVLQVKRGGIVGIGLGFTILPLTSVVFSSRPKVRPNLGPNFCPSEQKK